MTFRLEVVGTKHFGPSVDVTDPCYDRDVWCRLNNVKIKEGEYQCVVWKFRENCAGWDFSRIGRIGIFLNGIPNIEKLEEIGTIGVDAGLAGFFENKPDYTDEEWSKFCMNIRDKDCLINDEGFFSSSGYGDGEYGVYAEKDENGEIISLVIDFI